jgi:hypothetical protein
MEHYPILFSLRDPVIGNGFVAGVEIDGRALLREEEDGSWVDGVFPGAVCAGGATRDEALLRFRESYRSVLYDAASSASSFEVFKAEVERFFWEETPGESAAWQRAVEALRSNRDDVADWLPIRESYPEPSIRVVWLPQEGLEPRENAEANVELAARPVAA